MHVRLCKLVHPRVVNHPSVALLACSKFLYNIKEAFDPKADLQSLLVDDYFAKQLNESQVRVLVLHITCFIC